MLPVIALVGRPNVGKSTLFNRLTRSRDALVADQPGLTRDRQYGIGRIGDRPYVVVDTGGLSGEKDGIDVLMEKQAMRAVEEADVVLFLVDANAGLMGEDEEVAQRLRRMGKTLFLVVNKSDRVNENIALGDFYRLGLGDPLPIAAVHGRGVVSLMETVLEALPDAEDESEDVGGMKLKVAVVGRPNVGKSTLINRVIGEERVLAFDLPGTTRDSIFVPFERDGVHYTLIDTAGVRRRKNVKEMVEKFSIIKTLQAIEQSNVVILVLDAQQGMSEQDVTLAGHVLESGRAVVVAVNKWDGLDKDAREAFRIQLDLRLHFLDFAELYFISALHGTGVGHLLEAVQRADAAAHIDLATQDLTRVLEDLVTEHQPPLVNGRRIKLRYAHQGGRNPPIIVIHGNQTERVPDAYKRYLMNRFRTIFKLQGTPIRIEFKSGVNPFAGRRNKLTPHQEYKRKRLMKHVKSKKK
ncbi:MAG: ribosome biogenesis GTPase Der [Gammaproteobacteria bacterium]|nr:ribosome biogenesis GTPase Der [Gammaproteobacteria bacterium]MCP5135491.1 ribosome biogenesis GTPase Der [Gammaproteobacteria bacterium]